MPQMCCALYLQALPHARQVTCHAVCSDVSPLFVSPLLSIFHSCRLFSQEEKHTDVARNAAAFACTHHFHNTVMAIDVSQVQMHVHSASCEYVCIQVCVWCVIGYVFIVC